MKKNIKLMLVPIVAFVTLGLVACGNLSDEDSVWNRAREVEVTDEPTVAAAPSGGGFTAGTFEGVGTVRGFGGFMTVEVTIDDAGNIANIEVTNHNESENWYNLAVPTLTEQIMQLGSADVDGVTYATETSGAFIDAVRVALQEAE